MSQTDDNPTTEEKAKFLFNETMSLVGYTDAIETGLGESVQSPGEDPRGDVDVFVRNLEQSHIEGIEKQMQNKREHGFHPANAFDAVVDNEWPEWFQRRVAEGQHTIFSSGMNAREENEEYLLMLEEEYDVPR